MNTGINSSTYQSRINHLLERLAAERIEFDTVLIINKVNQFYYTGTLQEGLLVIRQDGFACYYVRKSYERARLESPLDNIKQINSYREMKSDLPANLGRVCLEAETFPYAAYGRLHKHFQIADIIPIDRIILRQRAVKDESELALIIESGRQHQLLLDEIVPGLLHEGMSEVDFMGELYRQMLKLGYHGVSRFAMFQMELIAGQIGFGENSLYPTNFDGPGGMRGLCPAVPIIGSRERKLSKGDLVFVDIGYGVEGYHSDKTRIYSFGQQPADEVAAIHSACRQVMVKAASLLVIGQTPANVYNEVMSDLPAELNGHFMGHNQEAVKFLGHGVGLQIDESPVIAAGQEYPLEKNMVVALEPKFGVPGHGMAGVEETFVVTEKEARCITGGPSDILYVPAP